MKRILPYKLLFSLILSFAGILSPFHSAYAQVTVTAPSATVCGTPTTGYVALGNIVIDETANGDFTLVACAATTTLILTAPAGVDFSAGAGTVTNTGTGDITTLTLVSVTATKITISFCSSDPNKTNEDDIITISGIMVRRTTAGTGNILRTCADPGTAVINGLDGVGNCDVDNFGTVTNPANPTTAAAGSNQTICTSSGTLAGNTPTTGTGSWTLTAGTATITTPTSPTSTITAVALGANTLKWTITNGGCTSTSQVVITNGTPTTAAAGTDISVCSTTTNLAGNTPTTGTGSWTIVGGLGGALATPTSPTSLFTGTAGTSYGLRWTITNAANGCTSTDDVTVNLQIAPTTAAAGSNQTLASGITTTNLAGNTPTSGTGSWAIVAGAGGTISTITSPTSLFTGTPGITYTLRWTVFNTCGFSTSDVKIVVELAPVVITAPTLSICNTSGCPTAFATLGNIVISEVGGSDFDFPCSDGAACAGGATTIILSAPANYAFNAGVGAIAETGPGATEFDALSMVVAAGTITITINANTTGVRTDEITISGIQVSVTNCAAVTPSYIFRTGGTYPAVPGITNGVTVLATLQNDGLPTTAEAGPDQQSVPGQTTVALAGNTPTSGTGSWTNDPSANNNGTFAASTSPTSTFTGVLGSDYMPRWTITSGCGTSFDTTHILFRPDTAGLSCSTCDNPPTNVPNIAIDLSSSPNFQVDTTGFSRNDQCCGFTGGDRCVRFNLALHPSAQEFVFDVEAPAPPSQGAFYYIDCTELHQLKDTVCVNGRTSICITFCKHGNDQPLYIFRSATNVDNSPPITVSNTCSDTIYVSGFVEASITWTSLAITGPPAFPVGYFVNPTYISTSPINGQDTLLMRAPAAPEAPQVVFRACGTSIGCVSGTACVQDTVNYVTSVAADAGPDQTGAATCGISSSTLAAATPTAGTGSWTVVAGVGGTIATPTLNTSTFSGTAGNTYTLRWTVTNPPCPIDDDDVIIDYAVLQPTIASAGADQTGATMVGLTSTTLAGNAPTLGSGSWTVVGGVGGSLGTPTSETSAFSGTPCTFYTLRWTITHPPCATTSDDMIVEFPNNTTTATAGSDQSFCGATTTTLTGNTPTGGTGSWTIQVGGGGTIITPTSPTSAFSGTINTIYTLRWTVSNSPCSISSNDVQVALYPIPAANAGVSSAICVGDAIVIGAAPVGGNTYSWSPVADLDDPAIAQPTATPPATVTYTLTETISATGCTNTNSITITVNPLPSATVGSTATICIGNSVTIGSP